MIEEKNIMPTIKKARELSRHASWLGFKKNLMAYLGIKESIYDWDVPQKWIDCFRKAHR
jgi:hypothetical protein